MAASIVAGSMACTSILGTFDFTGPATGGSSTSSASSSTSSSGLAGASTSSSSGNPSCTCASDADCPGPAPLCTTLSCDVGTHCCTATPIPAGMPAPQSQQVQGDCATVVCQGADAGTTSMPDPNDKPANNGPCNAGSCVAADAGAELMAVQEPHAGTCNQNGGKVCGDPMSASAAGKCVACNGDTDCSDPTKSVCTSNMCVAPTCTDKIKDGDETDVDCGGSCPPCADLGTCKVAGDCADGVCAPCPSGTTTCQNGPFAYCADTSFDWNNCGTCGHACASDEVCTGGQCVSACNPGYTACNGKCTSLMSDSSNCGACGMVCPVGTSCLGQSCTGAPIPFVCQGPTCRDGVKNGHETDVDCGGGDCIPCGLGKQCNSGFDCKSGSCVNNACAASCTDGIKDGNETDVDCGGSCSACAIGKTCGTTADCVTVANGSVSCQGTCVLACNPPYANCDGMNDCTTDLSKSAANCGACGTTCSAFCVSSSCNDPVAVAAGSYHTCAILTDGTVWCWGQDNFGQLGDELGGSNTATPRQVMGLPTMAIAIAAGGMNQPSGPEPASTCAVLKDGSVWCWGDNSYGQLGVGDTSPHNGPMPVKGVSGATQVAVGDQHACALVGGGNVLCWGQNLYGQLGTGNNTNLPTPGPAVCSLAGCSTKLVATQITAGESFTCAASGGGAVCWGSGNGVGTLGNGSTNSSNVPVQVGSLTTVTQVAASATADSACALVGSGNVYCWGSDNQGDVCNNVATGPNVTSPTVPVTISGVTQVAVGSGAVLGAVPTMNFFACGNNADSILGDGTNVSHYSPEKNALANVTAVTAGYAHACAITSTKKLFCWGLNVSGQVGNGDLGQGEMSPTPVAW